MVVKNAFRGVVRLGDLALITKAGGLPSPQARAPSSRLEDAFVAAALVTDY